MKSRAHLVLFWGIHLSCLAALFVPLGWKELALCGGLYGLRMFGITAGFHRYFAHRAFRTSRAFQFVLGFIGTMAVQKGPLWWASHHRNHHRYSDRPKDPHSPIQRGFWHAHLGWILSPDQEPTDQAVIQELLVYPELRWLDRYLWVPPTLLALGCLALDGVSGLIWGFSIGTVLLWHATFCINSLGHLWGSRRYETRDRSRNNPLLAILTMGEGWHNNHHYYCASARQGFFWWELDLSYYVLKGLERLGVVRKLRPPPARALVPEAKAYPKADSERGEPPMDAALPSIPSG